MCVNVLCPCIGIMFALCVCMVHMAAESLLAIIIHTHTDLFRNVLCVCVCGVCALKRIKYNVTMTYENGNMIFQKVFI